jgi:hypothetical protein
MVQNMKRVCNKRKARTHTLVHYFQSDTQKTNMSRKGPVAATAYISIILLLLYASSSTYI